MRLICASGDVGGARAMAPVAHLAARQGHEVHVIRHGAISSDHDGREVPWHWRDPDAPKEMLASCAHDALLFTTSVADEMALSLAFAARSQGLPTAHLLDNWTNYGARMRASDGRRLTPDLYLVMDDLAHAAAVTEGIAPEILRVTGTPALAHVTEQAPCPDGGVIFVSEPARQDQGRDHSDPKFRGYSEDQVLALVLDQLQPRARDIRLQVFPHPREDPALLAQVVKSHAGAVEAQILTAHEKPEALARARAVIGLSSILLYECWLAGLPCLSVQPDLRLKSLRYLQGRPGLHFVDRADGVGAAIDRLLQGPPPEHKAQAASERARHKNSARRVLTTLTECIRPLS